MRPEVSTVKKWIWEGTEAEVLALFTWTAEHSSRPDAGSDVSSNS